MKCDSCHNRKRCNLYILNLPIGSYPALNPENDIMSFSVEVQHLLELPY